MADLALEWGGDLTLAPNGDLAMVDGSDLTRQRILRRLLTAVQAYVWHPEFGAGLPQRIGRVARERNIQALVRANIALEATVARLPVPVITVTEDGTNPGLFVIAVQYTDAITGTALSIDFEVPSSR